MSNRNHATCVLLAFSIITSSQKTLSLPATYIQYGKEITQKIRKQEAQLRQWLEQKKALFPNGVPKGSTIFTCIKNLWILIKNQYRRTAYKSL